MSLPAARDSDMLRVVSKRKRTAAAEGARAKELEKQVEALRDELAEANELCGALRQAAETAFSSVHSAVDGVTPVELSSETCAACNQRLDRAAEALDRKAAAGARTDGGAEDEAMDDSGVRPPVANAGDGDAASLDRALAEMREVVRALEAQVCAERARSEQLQWQVTDLGLQLRALRAHDWSRAATAAAVGATTPRTSPAGARPPPSPPIPYSPGLRLATLGDAKALHQLVRTRLTR